MSPSKKHFTCTASHSDEDSSDSDDIDDCSEADSTESENDD